MGACPTKTPLILAGDWWEMYDCLNSFGTGTKESVFLLSLRCRYALSSDDVHLAFANAYARSFQLGVGGGVGLLLDEFELELEELACFDRFVGFIIEFSAFVLFWLARR